MFQYLLLIPAGTSLILGLIYVFHGVARPPVKIAGSLWFMGSLYVQFGSRYPLVGLLTQTVLAMVLAIWRRADALS